MDQLLEARPSHRSEGCVALRGGEPSMHIMLPWVNFNITVMIIAIIAMVFCEELRLIKMCQIETDQDMQCMAYSRAVPCKRGNPKVGGFVQFLFSLDVIGDEVNDMLVS